MKGTGPYGIGGRRYSGGRGDMAGGDYGEYDYGHSEGMHLTKRDMMMWKERMENPDGGYGGGITSVSACQNGSYVYWTAYSNSATSNGYFTIYTTYQSWVPGDKEYFFKIKFNGQPIGRYIKINGVLYDAEDQNI